MTGRAAARRLSPNLLTRLPMVLVAVFACYQFRWNGLRYLTSEIVLRVAEWRGFPSGRVGPDLISWNGELFHFGIACSFADVFCGAVPLVWVWRLGIVCNLRNLAGLAAALFLLNLFRLCLTDLIFCAGVPWGIAEPLIGGAAYFAVWVCVVQWLEFHTRLRHSATPIR